MGKRKTKDNIQKPDLTADDIFFIKALKKVIENPQLLDQNKNSTYQFQDSERSLKIREIRSKEYISVSETAILLDVSHKTIYAALKNKIHPFPAKAQRIGGCIKFRRRDVEAAFSEGRKEVK
jgi:hypothetical protein